VTVCKCDKDCRYPWNCDDKPVTRPAENQGVAKLQQTVERVFDWIDTVLVNDVRPNTQAARAALRDLAAKAELAEELGEALRESFTYWPATPEQFLEFPPEHDRVKRIIGPLARLDGVGE